MSVCLCVCAHVCVQVRVCAGVRVRVRVSVRVSVRVRVRVCVRVRVSVPCSCSGNVLTVTHIITPALSLSYKGFIGGIPNTVWMAMRRNSDSRLLMATMLPDNTIVERYMGTFDIKLCFSELVRATGQYKVRLCVHVLYVPMTNVF